MSAFLNVSTYRFVPLADLKPLRAKLLDLAKGWNLKGTVLLSTEGINLFVAGVPEAIDRFLEELRRVPGLEGLEPKISPSDHQPFTRMLVRIKKEIIAFGVPGIDPGKRTSPKLPARELKKWLDEGRPVTLLDTRNDYEIRLGTFKQALPIGVKTFRDFPRAVGELPAALKEAPIVMFCTGGIRCEKAGPYMESQGFKNIFQLDGGILKYFEEVGSAHYDGDCFVFDQRVGVDPSLHETPNAQCFVCTTPLLPDEQADPRYVEGKSCPYCFQDPAEVRAALVAKRLERLETLKQKLPGSEPYDNIRPLKVSAACDGLTLLSFVKKIFPHVEAKYWEADLAEGRFLDQNRRPISHDVPVRAGEIYLHVTAQQREPDVNAAIKILYEDEAIVVVDKPAPLPVHPCGRYNRNTLQYLLDELYAPQRPRAAHRLDANTSGVMVISRTKHVARLLQPQFSRGEVDKVYFARVQGHPPTDSFTCDLPIIDEAKEAGAREAGVGGQPSLTHFKVLARHADGTASLEVRPLTGRTNQIRVHLWELGFPICGDALYLPGRNLGKTQTQAVQDAPLQLRATRLTFTHPISKARVTFSTEG